MISRKETMIMQNESCAEVQRRLETDLKNKKLAKEIDK